jgi:hypothetical protein
MAGLIRITLWISGITAKMEGASGIFGGILQNYTEAASGFQGTYRDFNKSLNPDRACCS